MKVIIVGAGEVGIHIASALQAEGHDLVVIERDSAKVAEIQKNMDVLAVAGDGCNPTLLKQHGVDGVGLFFAVSNNDAVNVLAALTARRLGAEKAIVRLGNPEFGKNPLIRADEQIRVLIPERLVADEIFSLTRVPGASKARLFADGKLVLLQARPADSAEIYGRPLESIERPADWILTGIHRTSGTVIPRGDTVLQAGDLLYAIGPTETIGEFLGSIGVQSRPTRRVVIGGAGHVGASLAQRLVREKIEVVVIQRGEARAFDLASEVPEALVLRGDATDPELLRDAVVEDADFFIAATQNDEPNLLSALLARELGARMVVALYNRPEFFHLMHAVRIDVPLSPRMMTAGSILRMVHRSEIVSLDVVEAGDAEVVEFQVPAGARVLKKNLAGLPLPRDSVVGTVIRGEETLVPRGDFQFQEGDRALVFTLSNALPDLEKIFRGR